jgi:hypothetical protein
MSSEEIYSQLEQIAQSTDFAHESGELVRQWESKPAGSEILKTVFRFMESHPDLDFGAPGPLVHFLEDFSGKGYEECLIESVQKQPIPHTVWMLNRAINGASSQEERTSLLTLLGGIAEDPKASKVTKEEAIDFIKFQVRKGAS